MEHMPINTGSLLAKASRLWNQHLTEALRAKGYYNLKPSLFAVLIPLFEEDGQKITDLMAFSGLTKQTMSIYVEELKQRGYVSAKRNPEDKRCLCLTLTVKGKALKPIFEEAERRADQKFRTRLGRVGFPQLLGMLKRCVE
jgi:DNA-binding MarR family transcriptional regulator